MFMQKYSKAIKYRKGYIIHKSVYMIKNDLTTYTARCASGFQDALCALALSLLHPIVGLFTSHSLCGA